jgi:hypothetical protein
MKLKRVISGGQTGADIGALRWAKSRSIATGGWMPRTWKTEDGLHPEYASLYNMKATVSNDYTARTRKNIEFSNATLIIGNVNSRGSRLTLDYCKQLRKLYLCISWAGEPWTSDAIAHVRTLMLECEVLNVAGNRESLNPGIEGATFSLLERAYLNPEGN